ncbi:MAG TPA: hypothetical protein PKA17_04175 [Phenylobacterium sp.]|nr:hypothetical protein [Phenylobacterium sp.]
MGAALIPWPWARELKVGSTVPVTIVSSIPANPRPAVQGPEPLPAQTRPAPEPGAAPGPEARPCPDAEAGSAGPCAQAGAHACAEVGARPQTGRPAEKG